MAIKLNNSKKIEPNMSSMSDLVFLLLIFFMITSTLVSPNVISLSLPKSDSGQQNLPTAVEVYVDSLRHYYVINTKGEGQDTPVSVADSVLPLLRDAVNMDESDQQNSIILRSDQSVSIQNIVDVMDVISKLNDELETQGRETYKVALATEAGD